jgi:hypothetical protein
LKGSNAIAKTAASSGAKLFSLWSVKNQDSSFFCSISVFLKFFSKLINVNIATYVAIGLATSRVLDNLQLLDSQHHVAVHRNEQNVREDGENLFAENRYIGSGITEVSLS